MAFQKILRCGRDTSNQLVRSKYLHGIFVNLCINSPDNV